MTRILSTVFSYYFDMCTFTRSNWKIRNITFCLKTHIVTHIAIFSGKNIGYRDIVFFPNIGPPLLFGQIIKISQSSIDLQQNTLWLLSAIRKIPLLNKITASNAILDEKNVSAYFHYLREIYLQLQDLRRRFRRFLLRTWCREQWLRNVHPLPELCVKVYDSINCWYCQRKVFSKLNKNEIHHEPIITKSLR